MLLKPPPPPPKDEPRPTSPRGRTGEVFHHIGSPTACWSSSNNTSEVDGAPGFRTSVLPGLSAVALVMVAAPLTSGGEGPPSVPWAPRPFFGSSQAPPCAARAGAGGAPCSATPPPPPRSPG